MAGVKTSNFSEQQIDYDGWQIRLTSYQMGDKFVCQADNVSPGACLARFSAETPEAAREQALSKAKHLLGKTKRNTLL